MTNEQNQCAACNASSLQWLKEDFLTYLDDWEKGVRSRPGYSAAEKSVMLLSRETLEGIRISGLNIHVFVLLTYLSFLVLSFVELAPFLPSVDGPKRRVSAQREILSRPS